MAQPLVAKEVQNKVTQLIDDPKIRYDFEQFMKISNSYALQNNNPLSQHSSSIVNTAPYRKLNRSRIKDHFKSRKKIDRIQKADDVYLYRGKSGLRFIFIIKNDNDDDPTVVLIDVVERNKMEDFKKNYTNYASAEETFLENE